VISKRDLAPLFLEYYWPLEVKYHIRQGIDPDKDPIVMKRIRELMEAGAIRHGDALQDFLGLTGIVKDHQRNLQIVPKCRP
jgi:hypothetical protein